ncbi:hypothetical protein P7K49_040388 [Saguinus oedipus]|uniref:Uncharacterized protein n=1 Tax=Saguinus oedipus TaxID=9490 RepID=A0ABQ9T922_SAGOE|nr:hypothetical protein P7K49_040388 [Saguinus oedipus]
MGAVLWVLLFCLHPYQPVHLPLDAVLSDQEKLLFSADIALSQTEVTEPGKPSSSLSTQPPWPLANDQLLQGTRDLQLGLMAAGGTACALSFPV